MALNFRSQVTTYAPDLWASVFAPSPVQEMDDEERDHYLALQGSLQGIDAFEEEKRGSAHPGEMRGFETAMAADDAAALERIMALSLDADDFAHEDEYVQLVDEVEEEVMADDEDGADFLLSAQARPDSQGIVVEEDLDIEAITRERAVRRQIEVEQGFDLGGFDYDDDDNEDENGDESAENIASFSKDSDSLENAAAGWRDLEEEKDAADMSVEELFGELSDGKPYVTVEDVKRWDYVQELVEAGEMDDHALGVLFMQAGASMRHALRRLKEEDFEDFLEVLADATGVEGVEVDPRGSAYEQGQEGVAMGTEEEEGQGQGQRQGQEEVIAALEAQAPAVQVIFDDAAE